MTIDVGVVLPPRPADLGEWLADAAAFDAAGADALWVEVEAGAGLDAVVLTAALAAVTARATLIAVLPESVPPEMVSTLRRLSRGRYVAAGEAGRWVRVPPPESRAQWQEMLSNMDDAGVLVGADSRLLDLLRNPGDPGERHDLELAQG